MYKDVSTTTDVTVIADFEYTFASHERYSRRCQVKSSICRTNRTVIAAVNNSVLHNVRIKVTVKKFVANLKKQFSALTIPTLFCTS